MLNACLTATAQHLLSTRTEHARKGKLELGALEARGVLPTSTEGLIAYIGFYKWVRSGPCRPRRTQCDDWRGRSRPSGRPPPARPRQSRRRASLVTSPTSPNTDCSEIPGAVHYLQKRLAIMLHRSKCSTLLSLASAADQDTSFESSSAYVLPTRFGHPLALASSPSLRMLERRT